ncbi:LytR/AlgR family response regulator transcription factor [Clostridium thailandense]|uniref:LytR/AlgR family response regulator transcription factor n=1 Tax=Clostridium thailandense TaxID=2794346 RepID=UPI003989854E
MTLNFIICDDDSVVLDVTKNHIQKILKQKNLNGKVVLDSSNPFRVLEYSSLHKKDFNVYILDISLNCDLNGLSLARKIRKYEPHSYIIILTAHIELSLMPFKYRLKAFDFWVKPITLRNIESTIAVLYQDFEALLKNFGIQQRSFITVTSDYIKHQICIEDIIYIESFKSKLIIHLINNVFQVYGSMKSMLFQLEHSGNFFYRVHKSYIINSNHIVKIDKFNKTITMTNGKEILVPVTQNDIFDEFNYIFDD